MQVDLNGKIAVVSGGSSGMGAAICERLAASGAAVVVGGRDEGRVASVVDLVHAGGGRAVAGLGDVANSAEAAALIDIAVEAFGGIHIVVNAAGVIHRADALGTSDDDWARVMSVNVDGTFFLSRAAVPVLREQGGGVIVNISSTCGLVGSAGLVAYCASKGAVTNLTRAMALDHASEGIRINAICPGSVDTPMLVSEHPEGTTADEVFARNLASIPEGRIPEPSEVADLALFLCSDAARHLHGANLSLDGGYTAQ
ncbi:MAG: SDR family oxidoreductase [Acidimicrobiales bacterium]|nr:SDR family oxidoreductase [Acidimicrobiales bacterium]MDG1876119.1 SDR family oxidoreductase [Acidimicrobiales bacterium]